jgi:acylphosphatase
MTQLHVLFSGTVQGVGFRYTTQRLAQTMSVRGWVRNFNDGRVEMLAQGEKALLNKFLQRLQNGALAANIEKVECDWSQPTEPLTGFEVRRIL